MTLAHVAHALVLAAAVLAWRVSRPIGAALGLVFVSTLGYALAARAWPEAHAAGRFEAQRWVSALVGLVGLEEAGRGFVEFRRRGEGARRGLLGLACFASMAGDGSAHLLFRAGWPWVFDAAQIIVCGAMIAISVWPQRRVS